MYDYEDRSSLWLILPLAFIVFLVPLVVRMKLIQLTGVYFDFWSGEKQHYDFYSYYKMVWFIVGASFAFIAMVIKLYNQNSLEMKKTFLYIPAGIYALFIMLSSVLSKYNYVAFHGFVDRYEGAFVLLGYILVFFITINLVDEERDIKFILGALFTSAAIIATIGLFQYFNLDLFKSSFGKSLMIPSKYKDIASKLAFNLGNNSIYSTLYHYDYVGSYMAMLVPLSICILISAKKNFYKVLAGIFSLLLIINWIACRSRAGLLGGVAAFVVIAIIMRKNILKRWKAILITLIPVVILIFAINIATHNLIGKRISTLLTELNNLNGSQAQEKVNLDGIKDLKLNSQNIKIITDTEGLSISMVGDNIAFKDNENKDININMDQKTGQVTINDPRYKQYKVLYGNYNKMPVLQIQRKNLTLTIGIQKDGFKLLNSKGNLVDLTPVKTFGFEGKENFASSRGYIWSRSLPLLKNTIFAGYGPDTFAIYFPQHDVFGKLKAYGTTTITVDKPHDLYLNTALSTGVISLIAMLALFIGYIVMSFKTYFNVSEYNFYHYAGIGILAAVCGYLVAGIFNDSVISVAPVFWILLGVGISINLKLRETAK